MKRPYRIKIYTRICPVCGKEFKQTGIDYHTSGQSTCSAQCHKALRSAIASKRMPDTLAKPDVIVKRRDAVRKSPKSGAYETNTKAKEWRLCSPAGDTYIFRNLAKFLREHSELFTESELASNKTGITLAQSGLRRLRPESKDLRASWHGWTWLS